MVHSANYQAKICFNCGHSQNPSAKFCGACGTSCIDFQNPSNIQFYQTVEKTQFVGEVGTPTLVLPEHIPNGVPNTMSQALTQLSDRHVPSFAHVTKGKSEAALNEMHRELGKLFVLLARERIFLIFHFVFFAVLNLVGFVLALKCYHEFIGDEMTKIMVASTPFLFINSCALLCLIPIKGTRGEIARLKERISYVKFQIQFGQLM